MVVADLGDLESVRRAAHELGRLPAIHVLVHNAGALSETFDLTAQGLERTAAVQLVGPFLLTTLIRDQLASGWARVVWVTSGGMYAEPLDVDWLESPAPDFDGVRAYARVKRAQVSLCAAWAPRLEPLGITMTVMHPGWVDTPGLRRSLPTFARLMSHLLRTPAQGVDTILWLVTTSRESTPPGTLWLDRRIRSRHRLARTRRSDTDDARERLLQFCREMSGIDVDSGTIAMRMWMVDPALLCRKHLLGEHVECHMFRGSLLKGKSLRGFLEDGLLDSRELARRHDQIGAGDAATRLPPSFTHASGFRHEGGDRRGRRGEIAARAGDAMRRVPSTPIEPEWVSTST